MAGAIDYGALALALGGVLTLAIMIWIAFAGDGVASDCCVPSRTCTHKSRLVSAPG